MMPVRLTSVLLMTLGVLPSPAQSQETNLVRDGNAVAVIVVNESAAPSQGKSRQTKGRGFVCNDPAAANVLADWIEKITDVRLPIVAQAPEDGPAIYVGKAAVSAGLNPPAPCPSSSSVPPAARKQTAPKWRISSNARQRRGSTRRIP
jgi:hypothetical protein